MKILSHSFFCKIDQIYAANLKEGGGHCSLARTQKQHISFIISPLPMSCTLTGVVFVLLPPASRYFSCMPIYSMRYWLNICNAGSCSKRIRVENRVLQPGNKKLVRSMISDFHTVTSHIELQQGIATKSCFEQFSLRFQSACLWRRGVNVSKTMEWTREQRKFV